MVEAMGSLPQNEGSPTKPHVDITGIGMKTFSEWLFVKHRNLQVT